MRAPRKARSCSNASNSCVPPDTCQQGVALPQSPPVALQDLQRLGVEVEAQPVQEPSPILGRSPHQLPVVSGQCSHREELEVLGGTQPARTSEERCGPVCARPARPVATRPSHRRAPTFPARVNPLAPRCTHAKAGPGRNDARFPNTATASRRLVLPEPLGPTTTVSPGPDLEILRREVPEAGQRRDDAAPRRQRRIGMMT